MNHRYLTAAALLLSYPAALLAAEAGVAAPASSGARTLEGIVVTANRIPRARSATLTPTTVITRADIERTQAQSVRELLRRSPGVSVANQGGPGKLTSIFTRGTESDHTLVLVDGVRFGDATSGLSKIQDIPVSQIDRIEIVRGPRSSLYGSDAIGGVIQIFTRDGKGGAAGPKPYVSVGGGTYATYKGDAGVSGHTQRAHYNVSVSGTDTNGFDSCTGRPFGAPGGGAGCFANDPDNDGYSRVAGSLRAGYAFDNGLEVNLHFLRADGDNQFDGSVTDQSDTTQEVYGVSAAARPAKIWRATLSLGRSRDISDDSLGTRFVSHFETIRNSVGLKNDIDIDKNNVVTIGVDYRQDEVASSLDFTQNKRDNKGVYGQYLGSWGPSRIQFAVRGDDNQQFGGHTTGSVSYGLDVTETETITLSYGTAFKAPTFNDLYFPSSPGFAPASNPDLDPEKSESYEIGFASHPGWGRWSIHGYETRIDDLISLNDVFTPQNLSKTRIRGVEADAEVRLGAWQINANTTWLDAENRADGPNAGNELPRRPEYSGELDVDRAFGRFSAGGRFSFASSRYDDVANTRKLDSYALVGLRGAVRLNAAWRLQARLSNLFDEHYQTIAFYNQPGRSFFVTLRYQP